MAGHKRPNGVLICPAERAYDIPDVEFTTMPMSPHSPLRREVAIPTLGGLKAGEVFHYRNPNWEEPESLPIPYLSRPVRHSGTPDSWVSTEPADDLPVRVKRECDFAIGESDEVRMLVRPPSEAPTSSSAALSSFTSSRIRRSFTTILNNTAPLLSLFSARREDVSKITQTARRNGLHTGVMRPPDMIVLKEESDSRCPSGSKTQDPLWVIVGTDAVAVEHILDLKETDALVKLAPPPTRTRSPVGPSPVTTGKPHQFTTMGLICLVVGLIFFAFIMCVIGLSLL
jgi:hypothetical protein